MKDYKELRCPGCGCNGLVPADFRPAHFTGSLSHLSAGYCTVSCARVELNRLLVERARVMRDYCDDCGQLEWLCICKPDSDE